MAALLGTVVTKSVIEGCVVWLMSVRNAKYADMLPRGDVFNKLWDSE